MAAPIDITGKKWGRLTALRFSHVCQNKKRVWVFLCDCGEEHLTDWALARSMKVQSCGCLRKENAKVNGRLSKGAIKHGLSATPEYAIWSTMKSRCNRISDKDYPGYGGRGIYVCPEWNDFTVFINDMGRRPSDDLSIDRIDNDDGYHVENCRWASDTEQAKNRRTKSKNRNKGA